MRLLRTRLRHKKKYHIYHILLRYIEKKVLSTHYGNSTPASVTPLSNCIRLLTAISDVIYDRLGNLRLLLRQCSVYCHLICYLQFLYMFLLGTVMVNLRKYMSIEYVNGLKKLNFIFQNTRGSIIFSLTTSYQG